jgi:hypothetical protein
VRRKAEITADTERSDVHRRLVDREPPVGKPAGVFLQLVEEITLGSS